MLRPETAPTMPHMKNLLRIEAGADRKQRGVKSGITFLMFLINYFSVNLK